MSNSTTKRCCRCKLEYPRTLEYFEAKPTNSDGLRGACRTCEKRRKQKDYAENKHHYKALHQEWIANNQERKNEHARKDYYKHHEARKQKRAEWRETHKHIKHQNYLDFKRLNPELVRERRRLDHIKFPYRTVEQARRRRARAKGVEGSFTQKDVCQQYQRQSGLCWWCGEVLGEKYHADHYIPLARGGNNKPENIVCACHMCNSSRQDRLPWEWEGRPLWFRCLT